MRKKAPRIVTIVVLTTITIIFYVFVNLYQLLTKDAEINVPESLLTPIDPTLDVSILQTIEGKLFFEEGQVAPLTTE